LIEKITPLAWSPLARGLLVDTRKTVTPEKVAYQTEGILRALDAIAKARGSTRAAVALAWLLKHPSGIIPIVGSTNPVNIREAATAAELELTREEWYPLLTAARGERLP
jgi:predicted oxidoreductase